MSASDIKPAATILLLRDDPGLEVLMVKRHHQIDFASGALVFPGGRVEAADAVLAGGDATAAFRIAAIRETWEEAGLLLAKDAPARRTSGPWRDFVAQGVAPDLEGLEIVARAVTPPMLAKRFDTWFLMADAERLISLERKPDCGELEEIAWVDFDEAIALPLPSVTRTVIGEAIHRLEDPDRPRPFMRFGAGATRLSHL